MLSATVGNRSITLRAVNAAVSLYSCAAFIPSSTALSSICANKLASEYALNDLCLASYRSRESGDPVLGHGLCLP